MMCTDCGCVLCADRVVDDMNPVLTFTRREVESLLHFVEEEPEPAESAKLLQPGEDMELVIKHACQRYPHLITKVYAHTQQLITHVHTHIDMQTFKADRQHNYFLDLVFAISFTLEYTRMIEFYRKMTSTSKT